MTNDEINGKIAEKVMGWVLDDDGYWHDGAMRLFVAPDTRAAKAEKYSPDFEVWSPSTRWDHFGPVLGRFCEANEYATLAIGPNKAEGFSAVVTEETGFICIKHAATRLEAACAALLEAWGDD